MCARLQIRQKLHLNKLPKRNLPPFILRTRYWLSGEIFFFRFSLSTDFTVLPFVFSVLLYTTPLSFYLSSSRAGNIYYFRSVSLIRILKQCGLVMKNRGPFYCDIDDGKCFVRLSHWAHLETHSRPFFFFCFSLSLSLYLPLSRSLFSRSCLSDVKSHER